MRRDDLAQPVRERLKRYPEPYASHYGVVPLPPPEGFINLGEHGSVHYQAAEAIGRLDVYAKELSDPYILSRILTRREAVSSSAIEGTHSTLDELLSLEETEEGTRSHEVPQVRNYALALDQFIPRARTIGSDLFNVDLVTELHRAVMRGDTTYRDIPGEFRQIVVWIGGRGDIAYSTYNPAPPDDVAESLRQTMAYMQGTGPEIVNQTLLTRMAIAHAHFESVHPFRDGNGRVGRLFLPLMMAAEGHVPLYLSPFIEAYKQDYYDALKAAQQRLEWEVLVGFLAQAVVGTADELMSTRQALAGLQGLWKARAKFRTNSSAERALSILPHYPVVTVKRLAERLAVSYPAAAAATDQLVEAGILIEQTGYERNRIFVAKEALSIVNRPFGADPILPDA
jgi:Fic family protein